jgi:streptogramin lyase
MHGRTRSKGRGWQEVGRVALAATLLVGIVGLVPAAGPAGADVHEYETEIDLDTIAPAPLDLVGARDDVMWALGAQGGCICDARLIRVDTKSLDVDVFDPEVEITATDTLAIDGRGSLWIADSDGHEVVRMRPDGQRLAFSTGTALPVHLAVGPDGNVWFALQRDAAIDRVGRITTGTTPVLTLFTSAADGVRFVAAGADSNVYALTVARTLVRFSPTGVSTIVGTVAGSGVPSAFELGPDQHLWSGQRGTDVLARTDEANAATQLFDVSSVGFAGDLSEGPGDGRLWFGTDGGGLATISSAGVVEAHADLPGSIQSSDQIARGFDGRLWVWGRHLFALEVREVRAPTLLAAAPGNGRVTLSWQPSNAPADPLTGFRILRNGVALPGLYAPHLRSTVLVNQSNGVSATWQVRAVNAIGSSPPSNARTATPRTVPGAPALSGTPGDGQVLLTWTAPATNGAPILGYRLTVDGVHRQGLVPAEPRSLVVTGLPNGVAASLRLTALNVAGLGAPSNTVVVTPQP